MRKEDSDKHLKVVSEVSNVPPGPATPAHQNRVINITVDIGYLTGAAPEALRGTFQKKGQ